jgi:TRAP-type C4-dicarboxylate transport system substrate-binding protein
MRYLRALSVAAAVTLLATPALAATEWLMATGYPDNNFHTVNHRKFVEEVEAETKGEIKITMHTNGTLIKESPIKRAVQSRQVQMGEIRLGVYGNEDPMYVVDGLPFLATTYEDSWKLKEAAKGYLNALFAKNGMRILYYSPWPGQGFYTKTPVNTAEDLKGKKLRIYSLPTQKMGDLLGMRATILPFAEIPQAFSSGLIDALFTSPQTGIDIQAWENTSYFTNVGAIFSRQAVIVNEAAFSALPKNVQDVMLAAAERAEKRAWTMSDESNKAQLKILAEKGMKVSEVPAPLLAQMKKMGATMLEDWRKTASPEANAALDNYLKAATN